MPSNNEIVQNAVEEALISDDTIDLLLISDTLDDINGEDIGEPRDYGMNFNYLYIGMSGRRMVDQMNSNWRATDAEFLAHNNALNLRIISNQIKEIKVENDIAYYTTDGTTWKSLLTTWGKITGDLTQQEDLNTALNDRVKTSTFNTLAGQVSTNTSNIITLQGNVSGLTDNVVSILNTLNSAGTGVLARLDRIDTELARRIISTTVKQIRTAQDGVSLEFTTNGTDWHPVSNVGVVEWGTNNIVGDITNQADLMNYLNRISPIETTLSTHVENLNNPHQVTKAQVGLGNADNTSDANKPLSTPQKTYVDNEIDQLRQQIVGSTKFQSLTHTAYEAIQDKDNTTLYFINDRTI